MKRNVAMLMGLVLIAASGCKPQDTEAEAKAVASYDCGGPAPTAVEFYQGYAVLLHDGATLRLEQARTGSGFLYRDDKVELRGKGSEIIITTAGIAPLSCTLSD